MTRVTALQRRGGFAVVGAATAATVAVTGLVTPAEAATKAKVNVVHGIPGVTVNVCVDGATVADNFRYGNKLVGAALSPGTHKVRLVAAGKACTAPAILKSSYVLKPGRNYTVVANLNAKGKPNLKAFADNMHPTGKGFARLTVRHTAQAPAVNVWANSTKLIGGSWFTWGDSATSRVPACRYAVKVTLPGSTAPVIGPRSLTLKAGHAYQVYAVGSPGHFRFVVVKAGVGAV